MDIYVPQEEGAKQKEQVNRLDEAEVQMKTLLLDTSKLAAAATLATVKYHEPSFDLQKVAEDVNLSELVNREDI
jgi:intergrase/recombinase